MGLQKFHVRTISLAIAVVIRTLPLQKFIAKEERPLTGLHVVWQFFSLFQFGSCTNTPPSNFVAAAIAAASLCKPPKGLYLRTFDSPIPLNKDMLGCIEISPILTFLTLWLPKFVVDLYFSAELFQIDVSNNKCGSYPLVQPCTGSFVNIYLQKCMGLDTCMSIYWQI